MSELENELAIEQLILHQLLRALEHDLRDLLDDYVYDELPEELEQQLKDRRKNRPKNGNQDSVRTLLNGLFLAEAVDALNASAEHLPSEIYLEFETVFNDQARRSYIYEIRKMDAHHDMGDTRLSELLRILGELKSACWSNLNNEIFSIQRGESASELRKLMPSRRFVTHNLDNREHEFTKLVGRSEELGKVTSDLRNRYHNFVSIVAEGGLGKSALALEVGHQFLISGEFEFIFWYSAKTTFWSVSGSEKIQNVETDLLSAVASLGKVIDPSFDGSVEDFFDILDDTKTLIILDNFETFTGSSFESLVRKLPSKSNIKMLITSRWGIGNFENRIQLNPLSSKEAVHLVVRLAKEYGLQDILNLSTNAKNDLVSEFGQGRPLDLVWFARARASGIPTNTLRKQKADFLRFCVGNVIDQIDENTKELIFALAFSQKEHLSLAEAYLTLAFQEVSELTPLIQEAKRLGLITISSSENDASVEHLRITESAKAFLENETSLQERDAWKEKVDQKTRRVDNDLRQVTSPFNIYTRSDEDKGAALILHRAISLSRRNFEDAWARLQSAINLRPKFFENYRVAGFILSERDVKESKKNFEKALSLANPGNERAKVAYAFSEMLLRNGEISDSLVYAREAHSHFNSGATMLQLGNVLVRLEEFEEAESLFESALGIATWDQIKLIKTSMLRLYERFAQNILSQSSGDEELLIEILTKGNKLASSMLQQIDTDKAGSTAVIRFVGIMAQAWRVNLDRGIADVSQELELLLNELVPIVTNYGEQLYRNVNQNRLTYLSSQLRSTPWDSLLEVVLAIPQTNELIGHVGMLNFEKNFGFINTENERFVFFSRSFSIKSDFELCKVGSRVRFEISPEKPSGENRIAKAITIL